MERFDAYMDRCLYGPEGFYSTRGVAGGARGDFITSPSVGPLFGAVLANAFDHWWDEAGRPEQWTIYDVGCGPNKLLAAVARARPDRPWRLIGVDVASPAAELTELPPDLTGSVVVANELLDNIAFRIVEHGADGRWREVFVEDGAEVLVETEARLPIAAGQRAPFQEQAAAWCAQTLARGVSHLMVIDYGAETTAALAERGGWLRTYRAHQRGDDPYREPGHWDITTDVGFDQLPPGSLGQTQAEFLRQWGIEELVAEGKDHWRQHAHAPDLEALTMRSRVAESESLIADDGLGSWQVHTWSPTREGH